MFQRTSVSQIDNKAAYRHQALAQVNGSLTRKVTIVTKGDSALIGLVGRSEALEKENKRLSKNDCSTESYQEYLAR